MEEVAAFSASHALKVNDQGRRQVVRNGYLSARELKTSAGPLPISQPCVCDTSPEKAHRVEFSSSILSPYLRRSKAIDELTPFLYLTGISTGDFSEALNSIMGKSLEGLSPNTVVRLKETWTQAYTEWCKRDLSGKQYIYVWVDGIHVNVRLEDEAIQRSWKNTRPSTWRHVSVFQKVVTCAWHYTTSRRSTGNFYERPIASNPPSQRFGFDAAGPREVECAGLALPCS